MTHAIQLQEGEEILTIVRRHWFHLAIEGIVDVVVFVGVFIVLSILDAIFLSGGGFDTQKSFAIVLYILSFVALLLWVRFFTSWSDHWLDAWVITNRRIIDIEQIGFFRRQVSSFPIERIQDVTYDVAGVIAMWLHFGNIRIQTASISEDLVMKQVPFPEDVKEHLMSVLNTKK